MALKALCIGINTYPGTGANLEGCVNDANDWRDYLSRRGFRVTQLLDLQATNSAMLRQIRALIQEARTGDIIVITYSGHGSWIPDSPGGDEPDQKDEVLCPCDVRQNGPISDDQLYNIYLSLPKGVHATFISDSCHSGSVTRKLDLSQRVPGQRARFLPPEAFLEAQDLERARGVANVIARSSTRKQGVLLVSAARDDEYSYDARFDGRPNGAFTHFALRTLHNLSPAATYETWLQGISRFLPDAGGEWPQHPGLDGTPAQRAWSVFGGRSPNNVVEETMSQEDVQRLEGRLASIENEISRLTQLLRDQGSSSQTLGRLTSRDLTAWLEAGQSLRSQAMTSPNGRFTLYMQADGNLVLYDGPLTPQAAYWDTGTWRLPAEYRPTHADMQNDGNFVLYNDAMNPAWASGISGAQYAGAKLVLQDDGNLVICLPNGAPLWATNTVRAGPPRAQAIAQQEVTEVGWGKKMDTTATLYRNGTLTVESYQKNDNWFGGLRGRILVLCVDAQGNGIWISDVLECPTRCSVPDVSCASYGRTNFVNNFPPAVGRETTGLAILQADNPNYVDMRRQLIDVIKAVGAVAQEVKDQWGQLSK